MARKKIDSSAGKKRHKESDNVNLQSMENSAATHETKSFSEYDIHLFKEGSHFYLFEKLGAHITAVNDQKGVCFAVWAPNAERVSVIGDFNNWNKRSSHPLTVRQDRSGIWEGVSFS